MKRLITLLLAVTVLVSSFVLAPVSAQAKVKYTKKAINYSTEYWYGTDLNYAQYLVLKGKSKGVQKINKKLYSTAKRNVKFLPKGANEEVLYDYYQNYGEGTFYNTLKISPTYNKGKIFAVKYKSYWYQGGVSNSDFYGLAFNVKTGNVLKLSDLVPKSYNPATKAGYKKLRKLIAKKLAKKYDEETANNFWENYNTRKKLNNAAYVLNSKGKLYICFTTYDISYGARGCLDVKIPSKYAK